MELERVLTKLKFDENVSGYALLTNQGDPFLSFALPEETLPRIQGALKIHGESLKLINVMTDKGTIILARASPDWILAVNFVGIQLGIALNRTKTVVELLETVVLPPPPKRAVSQSPPESVEEVEVLSAPVKEEAVSEEEIADIPMEEVEVGHGCVVVRDQRFNDAISMDSELNRELRENSANVGVDILLMVDNQRTVFKISEILTRPVEKVIEVIRWCVTKRIVDVECPEEQVSGLVEIIEVPVFEGDLSKVKKEHRKVLEMCNGNLTLNEIATRLNITYFDALQCTLPHKNKSLRWVKRDKVIKKNG